MIDRYPGLLVWCASVALVAAPHTLDPPNEPGSPASNLLSGAGTRAASALEWSPATSFRLVPVSALGRMAALAAAERQTVLKLNRIDEAHLRGRALVIPDSIAPELSYAPLPPELPELDAIPKFILVAIRVQAFGAYEFGHLVRWGPVSTGRRDSPTTPGVFFTNWKAKTTVSTEDSSWILDWYVNFVSDRGIAFHQYSLPGRPASHGCVRLLEIDARWLFGWTGEWKLSRRSRRPRVFGTPVLVLGEYDYGHRPPWLDLPVNPGADRVGAAEVTAALAPKLPLVEARTQSHRPADAETRQVVTRETLPAGHGQAAGGS